MPIPLLVCIVMIGILLEEIFLLLNSLVWLTAPKSWANLSSVVSASIGLTLVRNAVALSAAFYWLMLFFLTIVLVCTAISIHPIPQLANDLRTYGRELPWVLQGFELIANNWVVLLIPPLMLQQLSFSKMAAELRTAG